jgi:hypothetical protein
VERGQIATSNIKVRIIDLMRRRGFATVKELLKLALIREEEMYPLVSLEA